MRPRPLLTLAAFALLSCAATSRAQQQDQKVIDDFVTSRGVTFDVPATKTARPQRQAARAGTPARRTGGGAKNTGAGVAASGGKGASSTNATSASAAPNKNAAAGGGTNGVAGANGAGAGKGGAQTAKVSAVSLQPIALGYTVFLKDTAGGLLAVDASREYHSGDRIAIALEPNTEGFIYVFNAENDRDPVMLFPNVLLDGGANATHAHVRETYPADVKYAFEFDQTPADEHVYVIVSRRPLEGVPTGDRLAEFCGKGRDDCYWKPTAEEWARIKSGAAGGRVVEVRNAQLARLQKQPVQPGALQRGIKLKRDDPAPAVVRMNDSPDSDTLVTVIKLVHK